MIILITGGQRSGKSQYAEARLQGLDDVCYIATAKVEDPEMEERVAHHQARRPKSWRTFEGHRDLVQALGEEEYYLLDCLGNMVSNTLYDVSLGAGSGGDLTSDQAAQAEASCLSNLGSLFDQVQAQGKTLLLVSNEVGSSLTPMDRLGRAFTDILGRVNQYAGRRADEAWLMVAGLKVRLK